MSIGTLPGQRLEALPTVTEAFSSSVCRFRGGVETEPGGSSQRARHTIGLRVEGASGSAGRTESPSL